MKKSILIFTLATFLFLSCNKDDDSGTNNTITSAKILGTWEVKYFENKENKIINTPPEDSNTPIQITFTEDGISGHTGTNALYGNYTVSSGKLTVEFIASTLATETQWGLRFMEAINNENMPVKIDGNTMIIEYETAHFIYLEAQ